MLRDDYKVARENAAVVKKDGYGIVRLTGSERVAWLQGMVTNDVQKLGPGEGCYAGHLSPQGKMIAHMLILRDDDSLWLVMERSRIPNLVSAFDKLLIMEDVQVIDESETLEVLAVIGPQAKTVLEAWLGKTLTVTGLYNHQAFGRKRVVVTNLGYDVWIGRGATEEALNELVQAGGTRVDEQTWDVLRTELGWPVFGIDIDETTTMPELGEHGISYDKGCYVGQEVVAKVKYIGHVNRRFVGLVMQGDAVAMSKSPIQKDGKEVGYITTSVFSPSLNKPIALGFVARSAYAPGTQVAIVSDGLLVPATIAGLPFRPQL
jgi:folate-binding protein YgfZ